MSGATSEEVALDFKDSLSDLQMNNRYEISNLTIIAKENIEHAQALSKALETHIRTTAPSRKLPALYVLDSVVKNIGSPYTIYLGRNLFSTFMEAYTLVDPNVRRSMESMLRTWKEPVPGSMDPTPVFPPETTRVIENALMKAKSFQTKQSLPPRPGSTAYRNTPTPPQQASRYGLPGQQQMQNGHAIYSVPPYQSTPQPPVDAQALLAALARPVQDDIGKLNTDIENLINTTKNDFAANVFDASIQQRLKALLDLQTIVKTQTLPPQALAAIKAQLSSLSALPRPPSVQAPAPMWQPPVPPPSQAPHSLPPSANLADLFRQQQASRVPDIAAPPGGAVFAPGALDALMASTLNGQKPSTPVLRQALPDMTDLPSITPAAVNSGPGSAQGAQAQSLIDALRSAGLASSNATPNPPPPAIPGVVLPPPQSTQSTADLLKALSGNLFPPPPPVQTLNAASSHQRPHIPISQASLKTLRLDIPNSLYPSDSLQCPTCALRFPPTQTGRAQKASHLDFHFRLNNRIADSSRSHRALHRKWFPDELEWIRTKEVDITRLSASDELDAAAANPIAQDGKSAAARGRKWTLADRSGKGGGGSCPICQDAFSAEWSDEAQDWVWYDTVEVGGRVYHVNCLEEVSRGASQPAASAKGGVLGKRKAEESVGDGLEGLKAKLKTLA